MTDFPTITKGTYRHSKTGNMYEVLGVAFQTETEEPLVIYRPMYAVEYELFARPRAMFTEEVLVNDRLVPRFEKI